MRSVRRSLHPDRADFSPWLLSIGLAAGALVFPGGAVAGVQLSSATVKAWDQYFAWADEKVKREVADPGHFLIEDFLSPAEQTAVRRQIENGGVVVQKMGRVVPAGTKFEVPDAELHHWWGAILVPGVKMTPLMAFLQDYERHAGRFSDVERSKMLRRDGNHFEFYFRLRRSKAFITVNYATEQYCDYWDLGSGRVWSRSVATKIAELDNPGTPEEREKPPGEDRGYLWRLVSWWRFKETDKGVIVQCESASLSRDIPGWIRFIPYVANYIRSTPRESLESILTTIREQAKSLR